MADNENVTFGQLTPNDIQQQYQDTCAIKSQHKFVCFRGR